MDRLDLAILSFLRKNARMKLKDVSRITGAPISTLFDRLKNRTKSFFSKYTIALNYDDIGFNTRAFVLVKSHAEQREKLKGFLLNHPHINTLCSINNEYDFFFECIFKNIGDLELFLNAISDKFNIRKKEAHYVLKDHLRENFFSDVKTAELMVEGNI